jgi:hypothetical protein
MKQSLVLIAVTLVATSGCVHESSEGSTRVFSYDLWVSMSVLLGGVIGAPAGWLLRKRFGRFGWALLIVGPLAAVLLGPSLFLERSAIDENGLAVRSGIWGMTAVAYMFHDRPISRRALPPV